MGNDLGKGANRMAISAMSNVTHMEKRELLGLQRKFHELAQREGNPNTITRGEFREALESVGITESDTEVLDRLFTMLDKTGDDQVNFREFVVGVAPLITGNVLEKLNFSFQLFDMDNTGEIRHEELLFILTAMNNTASYFGDPVMSHDDITRLVDEVFSEADVSGTGTLNYAEYLHAVAEHPVLVQFISGGGQVRYGGGGK